MNFLTAILDSVVGFIQRNPITCLVVFILAVAAPAVLKGIAVFILYFILGLAVLAFVVALLFRWRIYKIRKDMEQQFGEGTDFGGNPFRRPDTAGREGDVKIYKTQDAPEKRVSNHVGDYVDFEETKEETTKEDRQ